MLYEKKYLYNNSWIPDSSPLWFVDNYKPENNEISNEKNKIVEGRNRLINVVENMRAAMKS